MSVHDTVARLHGDLRDQVERLWSRHESGEITEAEFLALVIALLNKRIRQAEMVADLAVAAELTRLRGELVAPVGLATEPDPEAVGAALRAQEDTQAHQYGPALSYAVGAAALVLAAFQSASVEAMRDQGVEYVIRIANPDACEVCRDLDGQIKALGHKPWHHKGCACIQKPTNNESEFYA